MPAFMTHYFYGVDLYQSLDLPPLKRILKKQLGAYRLGLQGPDIFFYHPPSLLGLGGKKIGSLMHESKVAVFFYNYLKSMNHLSSFQEQEIALAYLCGLIAHNTLDGYVHPYVYSRAGYDPMKNVPNQYYFGMHGEIESCIDFLMLQRTKKLRPSQFYQSKTIHLTRKQADVIAWILSRSMNKTYFPLHTQRVKPYAMKQAFLCTKIATSVLHSNYGIRKKILHTLEQKLFHYNMVATTIAWDGTKDLYDAMNEQHKAWKNPWKPELISTESFDELYHKAKIKYERIMPLLYDYVMADLSRKPEKIKPLLKELGNVSYHSGLDCECGHSK